MADSSAFRATRAPRRITRASIAPAAPPATLFHGTAEKSLDVVISADPALAPIGAAFRHMVEVAGPAFATFFGDTGNFTPLLTELFAKGTPIRVGPLLKLQSLSTDRIGAERFELPGAVLEPLEFLQAVSPSEGGGAGLPPLP